MKTVLSTLAGAALAALITAGALSASGPAAAQVAGGTTTTGISIVESTRLAMGWSVKKTLLGKSIYNESGDRVGKVDDLIIAPDNNVTYVIVGAGGFIGIGRHDVAIPVSQIQDQAGKLVMAGASKDAIKAMPEFVYATDTTRRDRLVTEANQDIAKGKAAVSSLQQKAGSANAEAKAQMDRDISEINANVKSAEATVSDMKKATAARWKEFRADVEAATARLRVSIDKSAG